MRRPGDELEGEGAEKSGARLVRVAFEAAVVVFTNVKTLASGNGVFSTCTFPRNGRSCLLTVETLAAEVTKGEADQSLVVSYPTVLETLTYSESLHGLVSDRQPTKAISDFAGYFGGIARAVVASNADVG